MQLVGDRQAKQIGDQRAVKRCQQCDRHERAEFRGISHVGEHLHHAEQRSDHPERRGAVADSAVDLLAFVEMGQKIVAVALEIVADEIGVVTVRDEAYALGEKRVRDLDVFETHRAVLAHDFGKARKFVHQFALAGAAQA